ncbi:hypothetical protein VNI00_006514 [Paramarasmius palmivorus]|uniref:D-lactate dehydratase n=1 Tax=Paramarasmius palmivorus TaxID=297713 RepID=A0AAW0D4W9_9AGAR
MQPQLFYFIPSMGETSSKLRAEEDDQKTPLPSQLVKDDDEPNPQSHSGCSSDDAGKPSREVQGQPEDDKTVTRSLLSEEMKKKLKRVGDMEDISESRDYTYQQARESAPEFAQRMDGGMIAIEGLFKDAASLFQGVIVKELYEAGVRAEDAGLRTSADRPPKPLPAVPVPTAIVLSKPLSSLQNTTIDLSGKASPCRFRLIDCAQLVHEEILQVIEYPDPQDIAYAAISYIWRGVIGPPALSFATNGTFAVKGAEDGDPVSIDVLLHACKAALLKDIPLLWLDRLCIIQTSRDDKVWQIQRMYRIYAECAECFILPGGTRRLVSLEEPTMWIHRGWTLQEAVAPRSASVVIQWEHGDGSFGNPKQRMGTSGVIEEIVPGQSAYILLTSLVNASIAENVEFRVAAPGTYTGRPVDVTIRIFGNDEAGWRHAFVLSAALKPVDDKVDPNGDKKRTAIWRSAQMRTSSRPVDMVFSIMGLFGVTLDPRAFKAHDRLGATIALAREILDQGGSPNWFAISLALPHNNDILSFPMFPETNEAGAAIYEVNDERVEAAELMKDVDGWLGVEGIPGATMDEAGFLTIKMKSVPVRFTGRFHASSGSRQSYDTQLLQYHDLHQPPFMTDQDGRIWETLGNDQQTKLYVVLLGRMHTQSGTRYFDPQTLLKGVLLLQYAEGKFRRFRGNSGPTSNPSDLKLDLNYNHLDIMPSALVLIADGTEEMEFTITYDTLVRAGIKCQSAFVPSKDAGNLGTVSPPAVKGSRGINILPDTFFEPSGCGPDKFDAFIIPGGAKGAETMSTNPDVQVLVRKYIEQKKWVGMVCAGSLTALTSGLPSQPLTSHPSVKSQLDGSFTYSEDPVVVSGNLVTSRGPGTTFPFALTLVELLCGKEKRAEVQKPMVFPPGTPW